MTTADDVLNIQRSFIGNFGGMLFQDWYGMRGAWCAMFQSYCFDAAGMPLPASSPKGFAWVSAGFTWMRNQGWTSYDVQRDVRPGSLLAFEWGSTPYGYDHIGICESVTPDGIITIEGNVQNRVQRLYRSFANGGVVEIANPPYASASPITQIWKGNEMYKLRNVDGRYERFIVGADGRVLVSYQTSPNSSFTNWVELKPGLTASSIFVAAGDDGRLCVEAVDSVYGTVFGTWQSSPGAGPWVDWFVVNDLIEMFNA